MQWDWMPANRNSVKMPVCYQCDQLVAGGVLILFSNLTFICIYASLELIIMELNYNLLSI